MTLKDFHHIFQNVIAARQKDLELDSDYNSFSFKLFSSVISDQFSRKSTFDSINDIDLFDLKVRSLFSLKSLNTSLDKHVSLKQLISFVSSSKIQSLRNYERKHQNDLFIRDNAIEKFFRVSNMTNRNAKSADFHESLTLRRSRRAFKLSNSDRRNLDRRESQRFRHIINIRESQKIQNRQSQNSSDHSKSIKVQRSKSSEERDQRHWSVTNSQEVVQLVRIRDIKRFAHQVVNHHFSHQLKRHRLRSTIQKDAARHTKDDHRNVHQWQYFDFVFSSRSRREIRAIWRALCLDARYRVCRT